MGGCSWSQLGLSPVCPALASNPPNIRTHLHPLPLLYIRTRHPPPLKPIPWICYKVLQRERYVSAMLICPNLSILRINHKIGIRFFKHTHTHTNRNYLSTELKAISTLAVQNISPRQLCCFREHISKICHTHTHTHTHPQDEYSSLSSLCSNKAVNIHLDIVWITGHLLISVTY